MARTWFVCALVIAGALADDECLCGHEWESCVEQYTLQPDSDYADCMAQ